MSNQSKQISPGNQSATAVDHHSGGGNIPAAVVAVAVVWFTFEFCANGTLERLKNLQTDGIVTGDIDHNRSGRIWWSRLVPAQ